MQRCTTSSARTRILHVILCVLLLVQSGPLHAAPVFATAQSQPRSAAQPVPTTSLQSSAAPLLRAPAAAMGEPSRAASAPGTGMLSTATWHQPGVALAPIPPPHGNSTTVCTAATAPVSPRTTIFLPLIFNATHPTTAVAGGAPHLAALRPAERDAAAPSPPIANPCVIYALRDVGTDNAQFVTIDVHTHSVMPLGPVYRGADLEALDLQPQTQALYAASGADNHHSQKGYLFRVDKATGALRTHKRIISPGHEGGLRTRSRGL